MSSLERSLITKLLEERNVSVLEKHGIDSSHFGPETRHVYMFILQHLHDQETYGQYPSKQKIQRRFVGFDFAPSSDDLTSLCVELRDRELGKYIARHAEGLFELSQDDPIAARRKFLDCAAHMIDRFGDTTDVDLVATANAAFDAYLTVKDAKGLLGLPWPWKTLNEESMGIHPGELIIVAGRPGTGKTWVLNAIALHAYVQHGARVLFLSHEMMTDQIRRRLVALFAAVDYGGFLKGTLNPFEEERVQDAIRGLADVQEDHLNRGKNSGIIIVQPSGDETSGVMGLRNKIEMHKPDLVCIDAAYLMRDDREGKRTVKYHHMANLTQDLKSTATSTKVPIIITHQINRAGEKVKGAGQVDTLAYSDSFGQDADLVLRLILEKKLNRLEVVFAKAREFSVPGFYIRMVPAISFDEIEGVRPSGDDSMTKDDADAHLDGSKGLKRAVKGLSKLR